MDLDPGKLIELGWNHPEQRPKPWQLVVYLFEPFMGFYVGRHDEENDSVYGRSGFTSWNPEVLCWYPLPFPEEMTFL